MNKLRAWFLLQVIAALTVISCAPLKKFDFKSAYKFRYLHFEPVGKMPDKAIWTEDSARFVNIPDEPVLYASRTQSAIPDVKPDIPNNIPEPVKIHSGGETTKDSPGVAGPAIVKNRHVGKLTERPIEKGKKLEKRRRFPKTGRYGDSPPALKGFIIVCIGFGVVLLGVFLGSGTFPWIVMILGFGIVAFGFIKILATLL